MPNATNIPRLFSQTEHDERGNFHYRGDLFGDLRDPGRFASSAEQRRQGTCTQKYLLQRLFKPGRRRQL